MRWSWAIVAVAIASLFAATLTPVTRPAVRATPKCGVFRWPVKTLADPFAPTVRLTPKDTTIANLRRRKRRVGIEGTRGLGTERTTFRVRARLVEFKAEPDSDIHLVIADPDTGSTMIAEFPHRSCTRGALNGTRTKMQKARVALVDACGFPPNSNFRRVDGTATITGVGFFDNLHGQRGGAPNGIELHPVLRFSGHCL